MLNISNNVSSVDNESSLHMPIGDNAIFRDSESSEEKVFQPVDIATPYLPPYINPSRYPIAFQNSSNNTAFEVIFHFTPTWHNILILIGLSFCTIWVIVMNLILIGALLKGHKRDKDHVTDMYLINLLFADVLLGIFVFPFMSVVIVIGYFPLSQVWCNLWVYFDYYLIIASSYGFAALMISYLWIIRWPHYYPRSRQLHLLFILIVWIISNAPWTAPFINDRVSVLYPKDVCGFSIQKNRYFTLYIGLTGFYIPLAIALIAGIFAVKYLKQSARASFFKLLMQTDSGHIHPLVTSSVSDYSEFNDLYQARRDKVRAQVSSNYLKPELSPHQLSSESTDRSDSPSYTKRNSIISVKTFHRTTALQDSVKKHFPLVATSLILFVLSRGPFYTYFGIGSVVPRLFPPDLSHSVYWVMHSYAVLAPVVHLLLDKDLRRSVARFVNEGTFELSPFTIGTALAADKVARENRQQHVHVLPKVSIIDSPGERRHQNLTRSMSDSDKTRGSGNGHKKGYIV